MTRQHLPYSAADCQRIAARHSARWTGRLAHNTTLRRMKDGWEIWLHRTPIVRYHADGRVTLDSGGWQTVTTRSRWHAMGIPVYTTDGVASVTHHGREWPYSDGMTLCPDGRVNYRVPTHFDTEWVRRQRRRNRRRGVAVPCQGRQSSRWTNGNVPEAFRRECPACRGGYPLELEACPACGRA